MKSQQSVALCPICGEENTCRMASSETECTDKIEDCWCFKVEGKLNRKLLADLPDNPPASCLCQKCWENYQEK